MMRVSYRRENCLPARRGVILLLVLITGAVLSLLALAAVTIQTSSIRRGSLAHQASRSRGAVDSGQALAEELIAYSVASDESLPGTGEFNFPDTNQLALELDGGGSAEEPQNRVITSFVSGMTNHTAASRRFEHQTQSVPRAQSLATLFSAEEIDVRGGTLFSSGWTITNDRIRCRDGGAVHSDIRSILPAEGSTFTGRKESFAEADVFPFSAYVSQLSGVVFPYNPDPGLHSGSDLIDNGSFEHGDAGWQATAGTSLVHLTSGGVWRGNCIEVQDRDSADDGVIRTLGNVLRPGDDVQLQFYVLPRWTDAPVRVRLFARVDGTVSVVDEWESRVLRDGWSAGDYYYLTPTLTAQWTGTADRVWLQWTTVGTGTAGVQDFRIDQVAMTVARQVDAYEWRGICANPELVSQLSRTEATDVYVINAGGNDVTLSDSRIRGTLIVRNAGHVTLSGALSLQPDTPGYPALIVDGDLVLASSGESLNERKLGRTMNPPGFPNDGQQADSDINDRYAPLLNGPVIVNGDCLVAGDVVHHGSLIVAGRTEVTGTLRQRDSPAHRLSPRLLPLRRARLRHNSVQWATSISAP